MTHLGVHKTVRNRLPIQRKKVASRLRATKADETESINSTATKEAWKVEWEAQHAESSAREDLVDKIATVFVLAIFLVRAIVH